MITDVKDELLKTVSDRELIEKQFYLQTQHCQTLTEYLQTLKNIISKDLHKLRMVTQDKYAQPVSQAIQYIEKHYSNPLRLEDVAQSMNLNAVYLSSLFKKETNINFLEYVHNFRLNKAKILLKDNTLNISEVGNAVGYNDTRHFSKLFKKKYGVTPSDYRQMYS